MDMYFLKLATYLYIFYEICVHKIIIYFNFKKKINNKLVLNMCLINKLPNDSAFSVCAQAYTARSFFDFIYKKIKNKN